MVTELLTLKTVRIKPGWSHDGREGNLLAIVGIDAPDPIDLPGVGEPGYAWQKQLVQNSLLTPGIYVYYEGRHVDSFDRLVADVWIHLSMNTLTRVWRWR
jgi:hypothetical protein